MGIFSKKDTRAFKHVAEFVRAWPQEQKKVTADINGPKVAEYVNDMRGVYRAASPEAKTILLLPTEAHIRGETKAAKELLVLLDNFHVPGGSMVAPNVSKFGVKDCMNIVQGYLSTLRPLALRAAADHEGVPDDQLTGSQGGTSSGATGTAGKNGQQSTGVGAPLAASAGGAALGGGAAMAAQHMKKDATGKQGTDQDVTAASQSGGASGTTTVGGAAPSSGMGAHTTGASADMGGSPAAHPSGQHGSNLGRSAEVGGVGAVGGAALGALAGHHHGDKQQQQQAGYGGSPDAAGTGQQGTSAPQQPGYSPSPQGQQGMYLPARQPQGYPAAGQGDPQGSYAAQQPPPSVYGQTGNGAAGGTLSAAPQGDQGGGNLGQAVEVVGGVGAAGGAALGALAGHHHGGQQQQGQGQPGSQYDNSQYAAGGTPGGQSNGVPPGLIAGGTLVSHEATGPPISPRSPKAVPFQGAQPGTQFYSPQGGPLHQMQVPPGSDLYAVPLGQQTSAQSPTQFVAVPPNAAPYQVVAATPVVGKELMTDPNETGQGSSASAPQQGGTAAGTGTGVSGSTQGQHQLHLGRDAALGAGAVGAAALSSHELEEHRKAQQQQQRSPQGYGSGQATGAQSGGTATGQAPGHHSHLGEDALAAGGVGAAGAYGVHELDKHHQQGQAGGAAAAQGSQPQHESLVQKVEHKFGLGHSGNNSSSAPQQNAASAGTTGSSGIASAEGQGHRSHVGRDAALGAGAVGATALGAHELDEHRKHQQQQAGGSKDVSGTHTQQGRQQGAGATGTGVASQPQHESLLQKMEDKLGFGPNSQHNGSAPAQGAASGPGGSTGPAQGQHQSHLGRDAALGAGAVGAAALGGHELEEHGKKEQQQQQSGAGTGIGTASGYPQQGGGSGGTQQDGTTSGAGGTAGDAQPSSGGNAGKHALEGAGAAGAAGAAAYGGHEMEKNWQQQTGSDASGQPQQQTILDKIEHALGFGGPAAESGNGQAGQQSGLPPSTAPPHATGQEPSGTGATGGQPDGQQSHLGRDAALGAAGVGAVGAGAYGVHELEEKKRREEAACSQGQGQQQLTAAGVPPGTETAGGVQKSPAHGNPATHKGPPMANVKPTGKVGPHDSKARAKTPAGLCGCSPKVKE